MPRHLIGILLTGDAGHEQNDPSLPRRRTDLSAPIQVGTVGMIRKHKPPADMVWSDEAHLDASDGRRELRALYPTAFHLGTTGTPSRLDGRGLKREYGSFLPVSSVTELIALGYLADPIVWTVPDHLLPDLKSVRKKRGDYDVAELGRVSNRRAIVGGIVEHWKRHADGLRTFAFGVTKAHARHITRAFQAAGVPWGYVDGETAYDERQRLLDRVTDGDLTGLSCADLLTAGVDRPAIKCVVQARPTLSLVVHLQQTGRCMRPWGGVTPVILDHAGNSRRLGLPQEERDWQALFESETGKETRHSGAKVCRNCFGVMPNAVKVCRLCDTPFESSTLEPLAPEKDGALSRVAVDQATKGEAWATILKVAASVGADETWAAKVYETRFGEARRAA